MRKLQPHLLEAFDDTFNEAVQQLVQWGGVILGEDPRSVRISGHGRMWLSQHMTQRQTIFSTRDAQHDVGLRADGEGERNMEGV